VRKGIQDSRRPFGLKEEAIIKDGLRTRRNNLFMTRLQPRTSKKNKLAIRVEKNPCEAGEGDLEGKRKEGQKR